MVVSLIGYRASGKTSVAPALAARWQWDWVDADTELERRAGKTIRQIFADSGEPEFRRLEREILAELLGRDRLILAAGGGAILDAGTRARMKAAGPVVWLQADVETLRRRLAADTLTAERRPALTPHGTHDEIAHVLAQREPFYRECATLIVETDDLGPEQIVERIVQALPTPGSRGA
ncbi:MAG TPA: shikimate kinase [Planctomycetaceae bacterium]|nr:shikimate kinase [Planctomycetaceae bacterium]